MNDSLQFGPRLVGTDGVVFRLWAPAARQVAAVLPTATLQMSAAGRGWFEVTVPQARAGTRYKFRIDDDLEVPDPASAFQPQDAHGPSEVIDHSYAWQASNWRGRPWPEA